MRLIDKVVQSRRDFKGKYECQGCGDTVIDGGLDSYDDDYFHDAVIPDMKCLKCGESTTSLGLKNERIPTKYRNNEVV